MKKKTFRIVLFGGLAMALFASGLSSCGNSKKAQEENQAEDSLIQVEEMVAAVENNIPGINGTQYTAAFFTNPANKVTEPSDSGYMETSTGLKYVVVNPGTGKSPSATDEVTVHYVGTLTDGTQFDSSVDRGEPATFPLNRVISGWTEGLQLMKEGGVAVFYLPSNIAYGEQGSYNPYTGQYTIPPSAPLLFWVELIQVNKAQ